MAVKIELRPVRELLDPHFDGYKLSLDSLPVYRSPITDGRYFDVVYFILSDIPWFNSDS